MGGFGAGEILAGRFVLSQRIGAGGLAEVYAAKDRVSGSEVAVKILHAHLAEDRGLAERFRREMSLTRGLDHPAVVRVFDLHEHDGRPFFSMELLAGRTLHQRIQSEGPLPAAEARQVVVSICEALQAAHRAGVVHRDLKPHNVFLTAAGTVKVLDFGLARHAGQSQFTVSSAVMGTPGYIAPEVLAGQRADPRADLYSLGVTYFEMLAAHKPYATSDPYDQRSPIGEALRFPQGVAEADAEIIRRALQADPELRYLDASQMLRALRGEAVPHPPPTPPPMTAGDYDVLVHNVVRPAELLSRKLVINRVLDRLGADASAAWKLRLLGAGQAVLVSAASRRTAETAAAVCADHGLPATLRAVSTRPWSEEFLARNGGWLLALLGALGGAGAAWIFEASPLWVPLAALIGYVLSWGLRPSASAAPLIGKPGQDSSMARLADGIARRTARLQHGKDGLPEEQRKLVDDLVRAAGDAAGLAQRFSGAEADSSGALRTLDVVTARLLEIATALDDALAVGDAKASQSVVVQRLRDDVRLAQEVLPELRRLDSRENR